MLGLAERGRRVANLVTWFTVGCLALSTASAQESPSGSPSEITRLKSDKEDIREAAAQRIRAQRAETIRALVDLTREDVKPHVWKLGNAEFFEYPWHDAKHLAILLLGDLRAQEAVPVLLDNLTYRNPRSLIGGGREGPGHIEGPGWRPAVESLIKIGMPAVGPVLERLGGYNENCLGRRLCLVVIKEILDPRLAKARLQNAIEEAKDKTGRANLKAALGQLDPHR